MRSNTIRCPRCGFRIRTRKAAKEGAKETGYERAFEPWGVEEDIRLIELAREGVEVVEIAQELKRQPTAILRRLNLLNSKAKGDPSEPL